MTIERREIVSDSKKELRAIEDHIETFKLKQEERILENIINIGKQVNSTDKESVENIKILYNKSTEKMEVIATSESGNKFLHHLDQEYELDVIKKLVEKFEEMNYFSELFEAGLKVTFQENNDFLVIKILL